MKTGKLLKTLTFVMVAGIPAVVASVPRTDAVTNDASLYQNLHEIRVAKEKNIDFDSDIERLSAQEKSHRKALPLRVSAPMDRVMKTAYTPSKSLSDRVSGIRKASPAPKRR